MKITLEFSNAEAFFTDLPKFAALIGHASQFAEFDHDKQGESLRAPELPAVSKTENGYKVTGTKEQHEKVAAADKVARATNEAAENLYPGGSPTDERKLAAVEAPKHPVIKEPEPDAVDMITVRKALTNLNKRTGENTAHEVIAAFGYDRLVNVPKEKLPELMKIAELPADKVHDAIADARGDHAE